MKDAENNPVAQVTANAATKDTHSVDDSDVSALLVDSIVAATSIAFTVLLIQDSLPHF